MDSFTTYQRPGLPPFLRAVAIVLLVVQFLTAGGPIPFFMAVGYAQEALAPEPPSPYRIDLTPANIPYHQGVPQTQPAARFQFSANVTDQEIREFPYLPEKLAGASGAKDQTEDDLLAVALDALDKRTKTDDFSQIETFLNTHSSSRWRASLLTNLGILYYRTGYFTKALQAWEEAWNLSKNSTDPATKLLADRAVAELALMNARVGRMDKLRIIFSELGQRIILGSPQDLLVSAREGLWYMENKPEVSFKCGPYALDQINKHFAPAKFGHQVVRDAVSPPQGFSLDQVQGMADQMGMGLQMAKREPGAAILLPAVVHWKVDHYGALLKFENDRYLLSDPTFGNDIWISKEAVDAEASGHFLVPAGHLPPGWRALDAGEASAVFGKGFSGQTDTNCNSDEDGKGCEPNSQGMATYYFHPLLVSLAVTDVPVFYRPARGPSFDFKITFSQREANQPQTLDFSNLSPKWRHNFMAYLVDDPQNPSQQVDTRPPAGGLLVYQNFNSQTGSYAPNWKDQTVLTRFAADGTYPNGRYERSFPDGSKEIYSQHIGSAYPRRIYLTKMMDPQGHALTINYDGTYPSRISTIVDAMGGSTQFYYAISGENYLISKVRDPFNREAVFAYATLAGSKRLTSITDMAGMVSSFEYDTSGLVTAMTTPYGRTQFSFGTSGPDRSLIVTDPMGRQERMELKAFHAPGIPGSEGNVPQGLQVFNSGISTRNTFFWSKKAMKEAPNDYTKAEIMHWLFTSSHTVAAPVLESEKFPFTSRIWYNYPGQPTAYELGSSDLPSKAARLLDDGSTQIFEYEYNSIGNVTKEIDPLGRTLTYEYEANGIDLKTVKRKTGTSSEVTLASMVYNSRHQPATITDAAGQATTITYEETSSSPSYTLPKTITNPKSEVTTLSY